MTYSFLPSCIECPKNANCTDRTITGCISSDYRLQQNPLDFLLGGLLPFPFNQPKCVFDSNRIMKESKKKQQVDHLVRVLDILVREFVGKVACDSVTPKQYRWIISSKNPSKILGMPVELAKEELMKLVKTKWSSQQLEEYWGLILDKIQTDNGPLSSILDDTVSRYRIFTSSNPPVISKSCEIKRAMLSWTKRYSLHLITFVVILVSIGISIQYYNTMQHESHIVAQLVEDVTETIHAEREGYEMDSQKHPIPGLPVIQLRDYFVPRILKGFNKDSDHTTDENNRVIWYIWDESSRNRVWKRVQKELSKNSNIRETNTQVRGESHTVWMWIGSSVLSPKKRPRGEQILFGTVSPKIVPQ
jgi:hypothetical protein